MNSISIAPLRLLGALALSVLLAGCGGGSDSSSSSGGTSGLALSITDAPVMDADIAAVWVRFTQVIVHPADGSGDITYTVEDRSDPNDIKPYRDLELKSLVGGKTMLLGEIPLDAGDYSWIRLVIDRDHTYVSETSGGSYRVKCPSCTQSGFKLNRSFTIAATGWIDFTIDFDLRKSLTLSQPNKPRADDQYILRPTLRILETELASSYIHGTVTDQRTEKTNPDTPDACWVYVYEGDAASITPDDICLDADPSVCPVSDRPLLETPVTYDSLSGEYRYNTGYIYPGLYTVALLCQADDPELDDGLLLFMSETEVQADAVPSGATADLALEDVPVLSLLKSVDASGPVTPGDTLTYTLHMANDGNRTLDNVDVSDPLPGLTPLVCDTALPAILAPGAAIDCNTTYLVSPTDTSISNTATAVSDQTAAATSSVTVDVLAP